MQLQIPAYRLTPAFKPPKYLIIIVISIHLKLCLADVIYNFKWLKIIQIWNKGV